MAHFNLAVFYEILFAALPLPTVLSDGAVINTLINRDGSTFNLTLLQVRVAVANIGAGSPGGGATIAGPALPLRPLQQRARPWWCCATAGLRTFAELQQYHYHYSCNQEI